MSHLYRRKRSPYWIYSDGTGSNRIRKSTGATTQRLARMVQDKWDEERLLLKHGIKTRKGSLQDLHREYIRIINQRKSYAWAKRIGQHLKNFLEFMNPAIPVANIETRSIDDYISARLKAGRANKTVRDEVATISKFFEWAINNQYARENPCKNAILPDKITVNPRSDIPWDLVHQAIKNAPHGRDRLFWTIITYTGLRSGDAGSLEMKHFKDGVIDLEPEKTIRYKSKALIPIHPELEKIGLENLVNAMPSRGMRNGSLIRFKKACKDLGYQENVDLHSLRHTLSTRLAELGLAPEYIRMIVGHTKTNMTMQYIHVINHIKSVFEQV